MFKKITPIVSFLSITSLVFLVSASPALALSITDGQAADYVLGQTLFTTSTTATTASGQSGPADIAVDSVNNRLYVLDKTNNRVLVYNTSTISSGQSASYVLGQPDFTTMVQSTTISGISKPKGLALDVAGNRLFVSQEDISRISVFDVTTITNGEDAVNVLGQTDFVSNLNLCGGSPTAGSLCFPGGMHYDEVNNLLYVADTLNHRVLVYDVASITNGEDAINVLGQATFTALDSTPSINRMSQPFDVTMGQDGTKLFVSFASNARILIFDVTAITDGENAINVLGQDDFISTSMGLTTASSILGAGYVDYDDTNDYLILSSLSGNRILFFDMSSIENNEPAIHVLGQIDFTSIASNYGGGAISDGKGGFIYTSGATGVSSPSGLGLDEDSSFLYVTDTLNHRTLVFDLSSGAPAEEPSSRGYTHPPLCTATITPSTITKGEQATLSWDIQWPTIRKGSFLVKVPGEGLFNSKVQSISINPEYTTTYRISAFNLFGANFCETTVKVIDEAGDEQNPPHLMLSAGAGHSPFANAIKNFFIRLFTR